MFYRVYDDQDHDGSLPYLLEDVTVDHVVVSDYYQPNYEMQEAWDVHQMDVIKVRQGDHVHVKQQLFDVLSPDVQTDSANENSLVLLTDIGGFRWVFTGDVGVETEKRILKNYPHLQADVLKVGHHGSDTSTMQDFATRFHHTAWVSVGRHNMYGHPKREVIDTLEKAKLNIQRTDLNGAVQYQFKKERGSFQTFLEDE